MLSCVFDGSYSKSPAEKRDEPRRRVQLGHKVGLVQLARQAGVHVEQEHLPGPPVSKQIKYNGSSRRLVRSRDRHKPSSTIGQVLGQARGANHTTLSLTVNNSFEASDTIPHSTTRAVEKYQHSLCPESLYINV